MSGSLSGATGSPGLAPGEAVARFASDAERADWDALVAANRATDRAVSGAVTVYTTTTTGTIIALRRSFVPTQRPIVRRTICCSW